MDIYTVTFFGHRKISHAYLVEERLNRTVSQLLQDKRYVDFLVGRNGEFDIMASAAIRRVQRTIRHDNSTLSLILPYPTAEYVNNQKYFDEYYDEVYYAPHHQRRTSSRLSASETIIWRIKPMRSYAV